MDTLEKLLHILERIEARLVQIKIDLHCIENEIENVKCTLANAAYGNIVTAGQPDVPAIVPVGQMDEE